MRRVMVSVVMIASIAVSVYGVTESRAGAGPEIYKQHCASCHGQKAEGAKDWKNPNEQGELPAPPHNQTGHTWRHSDVMLARMINEGWRDPFNKTKHLTMPPFKEMLSAEKIHSVINFLKSLWNEDQQDFQKQENRH